MDPHLPAVMGALEESNEQFARNYAQYLAKLEATKAAHASRQVASAPALAAGSALARSSTGPGGGVGASSSAAAAGGGAAASLSDMLHTAKRIMEPEQRKIPEDFNDTRMFRKPLIPSQSAPTWDGGGGSAFVALLPSFSPHPEDGGSNALYVRAEFVEPGGGYDRLFGAVNLLADRTGGGGSTVLAQMCYRADPAKGGGGGGMRRSYVQGYKLGFWQTTAKPFPSEAAAPIAPGREFWWRLVVHPTGFASYVNGVLINVSPLPPGHELRTGQELYVSLPVTGDAGERATWRVKQLWWGSSLGLDPAAVRALAALTASAGAVVPNKVRATGVPAGTTLEELRAAWGTTPYAPSDVSFGDLGSAIFTFPSDEQVRRILAPGSAVRVAVRGAALTLSQAITKSAAAAAAGAAGGGVGSGAYR